MAARDFDRRGDSSYRKVASGQSEVGRERETLIPLRFQGRVSVVIAVHNGQTFLKEQLESVLSQTHADLEVVISDDASTDRSFEIASAFAAKDARVVLRRNAEPKGVAGNFLTALAAATGDFFCFCDQDDVWSRDKIATLGALLTGRPDNTLVYSDLEVCDHALRTMHASFWRLAGIRPRRGRLGEKVFLRNVAPGCSMMFRRSVKDYLDKLGPRAVYLHDHETWIVAAGQGRIDFTPRTLLKYRQHHANQVGAFVGAEVHDQNEFYGRLKRAIERMKGPLDFNWERIGAFAASQGTGRVMARIGWWDYYLFMRNDAARDWALGTFECFFPGAYEWGRKRFGR